MVVLDTSGLIYWTLDPERLSPRAQQAIDEADQLIISSISIWEIGLKVKYGRIKIPLSISEYADRLQLLQNVKVLPVDVATWLENLALKWEHKDPADRCIVATAILLGCPLITSDQTIRSFYAQAIW